MTQQEQASTGRGYAGACPGLLAVGMRFGSSIEGRAATLHLFDGLNSEAISIMGSRASLAWTNGSTLVLRRVNGRWLIASGKVV